MGDKATSEPVVTSPTNNAFNGIRASFDSICTRAGDITNQDALEHLSENDLRKLLSGILSVLQNLPLAQGQSNPVGLRIVVRHLQVRIEQNLPGSGNHFDPDRVKELLKAVLDDSPDYGNLWEMAASCSLLPGDEARGAIPDDARHFFLEQLHTVEKNFHLDDWKRLTKDLFNSLEYPNFDAKASISAFLRDQGKRLRTNCAKWAIPVCMVLRQLATEMRMAVDLVESVKWEKNVVIDALETLRFSIDDFYGPLARILAGYCMEKKDEINSNSIMLEPPDRLDTFGQVGKFCIDSITDAEMAFGNLVLHWGNDSNEGDCFVTRGLDLKSWDLFPAFAAAPAANKVPSATFTELLIRQRAGLQRRSIVTALEKKEFEVATGYISTLLLGLKEKRSKYPLAENSGVPRTMTIVVDRQTGIATTGATLPAYHNDFSPMLKTFARQIHGLRLGGTFRRAIHLCSDNVSELVKEAKSKTNGTEVLDLGNELVESIYSELMTATKETTELARMDPKKKAKKEAKKEATEPSRTSPQKDPDPASNRQLGAWYSHWISAPLSKGYEAIPGPEETLFCWAITSDSFEHKPPCLRCQRIYSQWFLHGRPDDVESKRAALENLNARAALLYDVERDACTYCAESVAAAKMYLLRNARLSLVEKE
ncbi:hypothetical protein CDV36_008549 [Fusarium kuroshium]|uniref:Uncharacterized protein n=1 Tax=Fusarium kuroshium TaxID=2010991 RepID=A0A3M2S2U0_9HYPO|nr:hypothetical protein CDV36_008549 [Fusarium kuroshium]